MSKTKKAKATGKVTDDEMAFYTRQYFEKLNSVDALLGKQVNAFGGLISYNALEKTNKLTNGSVSFLIGDIQASIGNGKLVDAKTYLGKLKSLAEQGKITSLEDILDEKGKIAIKKGEAVSIDQGEQTILARVYAGLDILYEARRNLFQRGLK